MRHWKGLYLMRLSFRRTFGAALAFGTLAVSGAALAGGGDDLVACREKGQIHVGKDRWTRISAPPMEPGEGPREVSAFAAAPRAANRIFATNGTVIKRSDDGGCTWEFMLRSSPVGEVPNGEYQADVFLDMVAPTDTTLWATSHDTAGGASRPHVHIFQKLDESSTGQHNMVENGLPPVGKPIALTAGNILGADAIYVLIQEPPDPASGSLEPVNRLYTTVVPSEPPQLEPIGTIWQQVKKPAGFGQIEGMAVGQGDRALLIWSSDKVALTPSAHLAKTPWTVRKVDEGRVLHADVDRGGQALVAVETSQKTPSGVLFDRELTHQGVSGVPVAPVSMAHGFVPTSRAVSGDGGTWGFNSYTTEWVDITPKGAGPLRGLLFASGRSGRIVLGHAKGSLYRFDMYNGESFLPGGPKIFGNGYGELPYSKIKEPKITPERTVVTVKPGEVKDAPIRFDMPPQVNPLDVYFLVDTTSSMQPAIDSLRADMKDIATGIHKTVGREACFGVGEFKDFDEGTAALDSDKVFRTLLRNDSCLKSGAKHLSEVKAALDLLKQGGGGDKEEAHTVALKHLLTGEASAKPPVLAGHEAGFRPGSYKIIVLITDAYFKQGLGYPTIEEVGTKLKTSSVKVVSVLVETANSDEKTLAAARADMEELAERTESLAPPGGVDCDNDKQLGEYDVQPGAPLICPANGNQPNIGPLIVSLLLGVKDPGTVAVGISDPDKAIRGQVRGTTSEIVDLKREASLGFILPVGCLAAQDGKDLRVALDPTVRALPVENKAGEVVRGEVVVRCRSVRPVVVRPPNIPDPPPAPPEPEAVPPIPPRQPIAIAVPPPLNPPAQPISNMNLNAGFSQQEEQQFQLAAVSQGAGDEAQEQEDVELAMMGLEQDTSATPVAAFLAGAMVISAAAGLAHRHRLQRATGTAYARVR